MVKIDYGPNRISMSHNAIRAPRTHFQSSKLLNRITIRVYPTTLFSSVKNAHAIISKDDILGRGFAMVQRTNPMKQDRVGIVSALHSIKFLYTVVLGMIYDI